MKILYRSACLTLLCTAAVYAATPLPPGNQPVDKINIFYFGNSYSGSTMPGPHEVVGKSAGKTWTHGKLFAPDAQLWSHRNPFLFGGVLVPARKNRAVRGTGPGKVSSTSGSANGAPTSSLTATGTPSF